MLISVRLRIDVFDGAITSFEPAKRDNVWLTGTVPAVNCKVLFLLVLAHHKHHLLQVDGFSSICLTGDLRLGLAFLPTIITLLAWMLEG